MTTFEDILLPEEKIMRVNFVGHFDISQCNEVTIGVANKFDRNSNTEWLFMWDCRRMTGFDQMARKSWMSFLQEYRGSIGKVVVISDNMIIRGAARLMLKVFGFPSEVLKNDLDVNKIVRLDYQMAS